VDVSVVIDRTLVYGGVTAIVVGVLAAINSLVEHAALGTNASLLLQIVVPLALGIVLSRVRMYLDRIVEQVFFRRKYLAEKALRQFARHCGQFERAGELLESTLREIRLWLNAPGVVIYTRRGETYLRIQQAGDLPYPEEVKIDDLALVAARSETKCIDLSGLHSALGSDGYVFSLGARAVLVCANRPGEHYAADELRLLVYVARQTGRRLDMLRMQETMQRLEAKAKLVDALASGTLTSLLDIQTQARSLMSAASMG